jgi:hypothetical protein
MTISSLAPSEISNGVNQSRSKFPSRPTIAYRPPWQGGDAVSAMPAPKRPPSLIGDFQQDGGVAQIFMAVRLRAPTSEVLAAQLFPGRRYERRVALCIGAIKLDSMRQISHVSIGERIGLPRREGIAPFGRAIDFDRIGGHPPAFGAA